jgi:hypothetical protein
MVDVIVRLTVVAVLAVATANLVHAASVAVRLGRYVARRHARLGLWLWLPVFTSGRDARAWVATWRAILTAGDPALARLRTQGRVVLGRYLQLAVTSNAWAMAVTALAPRL